MSDGAKAVESLKQAFADAVVATGSFRDQHWAEVSLDRLVEICSWLREAEGGGYDYLVDVTAVHWPDEARPMELVYHLFSYGSGDRLRLKARAAQGQAVPSVAGVWRSAEWNERETYDMFGIAFDGHPDLRRILMPDDYTDFPLRKEFPLFRG